MYISEKSSSPAAASPRNKQTRNQWSENYSWIVLNAAIIVQIVKSFITYTYIVRKKCIASWSKNKQEKQKPTSLRATKRVKLIWTEEKGK